MKTVKAIEFYRLNIDGSKFVIELNNFIGADYVFVDQSFHTVKCDSARKFVDNISILKEVLYSVGYTSFQVYNRLKEAIVLNGGELYMVKTVEVKDM